MVLLMLTSSFSSYKVIIHLYAFLDALLCLDRHKTVRLQTTSPFLIVKLIKHLSQIHVKLNYLFEQSTRADSFARKGSSPFAVYSVSKNTSNVINTLSCSASFLLS